MMKFLNFFVAALTIAAALPIAVQACGADTQCKIGDRHYYIALPASYDGTTPIPAFIFAHGLQGTALGSIRNERLLAVANTVGAAYIAVKSDGESWSIANSPSASRGSEAAELAYFDAVKADVTSRFAIDPDRIVMTGASAGGMMTWTLACERSAAFAGFVPMSGTFWNPEPRTCKGPITNIVHFHGDKDLTVPLGGRAVRGREQGDVANALTMYRDYGHFSAPRSEQVGELQCENSTNALSNIVNFCLYDGGHSFRSANVGVAWQMFEDAGQL